MTKQQLEHGQTIASSIKEMEQKIAFVKNERQYITQSAIGEELFSLVRQVIVDSFTKQLDEMVKEFEAL